MGSMHRAGRSPGGFARMAAFYAERARGGVADGHRRRGPNEAGRVMMMHSAMLTNEHEAEQHRVVTDAVHAAGGKIALQILHTGRYSYQPNPVAPSALQAPINPSARWR